MPKLSVQNTMVSTEHLLSFLQGVWNVGMFQAGGDRYDQPSIKTPGAECLRSSPVHTIRCHNSVLGELACPVWLHGERTLDAALTSPTLRLMRLCWLCSVSFPCDKSWSSPESLSESLKLEVVLGTPDPPPIARLC